MRCRKTEKLLKRTPMTKATAMMSKNLRDVWSGQAQVHTQPCTPLAMDQRSPVGVWPTQCPVLFFHNWH